MFFSNTMVVVKVERSRQIQIKLFKLTEVPRTMIIWYIKVCFICDQFQHRKESKKQIAQE